MIAAEASREFRANPRAKCHASLLKDRRPKLVARSPRLIFRGVFDDADVRKITIFFGVVEAISDHISIGNREADILRLDGLLSGAKACRAEPR